MTRTPIVISAVAAIALGVGIAGTAVYLGVNDRPAATPSSSTTPHSDVSPAADPYEVYLELAPKGAPKLSREDAQTRALLGCGQKWAPGTVDAVLATAYAGLCQGR